MAERLTLPEVPTLIRKLLADLSPLANPFAIRIPCGGDGGLCLRFADKLGMTNMYRSSPVDCCHSLRASYTCISE